MNNNSRKIELNWKNKKSIPVFLLLLYYLFVIFTYMKQDLLHGLQEPSVIVITMLWLIISFLSILERKAVRGVNHNHTKWISFLVLVLSPVASFLMVECMVSNFNLEMFKNYSIYNIIWYFVIYFMIYSVIRNIKYTVILGNILIYIMAMVNYLVYLFRGNPILPSDLLVWQTGMSVASNYELSFTKGFLIATVMMFALFVIGIKLENNSGKKSITNRIVGLGIYGLFVAVVFFTFFRTDLIETKIRVLDFFAPKYTYCSYGTAFGFIANVQAMDIDRPEGYSLKQVKAAYLSTQPNTPETAISEDKPNIIAIMSEALSDLSMIGTYDTNMESLPYTSTLEENTTRGTLYVSVFGGATSDTEYEFLTGNSMAVMPKSCVPYQQYITEPTNSLASTLKAQGYYNIAIHPYEKSGYKRDIVYPLLGFDEFLSVDDFKDPELIRSFVSDRESYQKIIEQYETKGSENPLFIFNVTMQNHGGYNGDTVFEEAETVRFIDLVGYSNVEQYLSLVRESDKAFQTLTDYFSNEEEHTVILLFGDHQPVVYSKFHNDLADLKYATYTNTYQRKYMVPFVLWANYDIPEDDVDKISANYLSSYLLKTVGLKGTNYNRYLLELYDKIPVINSLFYIDRENKSYRLGEPSIHADLIREYRYVGYNNALDKKDKIREFYSLE